MVSVDWAEPALDDLREIHDYIARVRPEMSCCSSFCDAIARRGRRRWRFDRSEGRATADLGGAPQYAGRFLSPRRTGEPGTRSDRLFGPVAGRSGRQGAAAGAGRFGGGLVPRYQEFAQHVQVAPQHR